MKLISAKQHRYMYRRAGNGMLLWETSVLHVDTADDLDASTSSGSIITSSEQHPPVIPPLYCCSQENAAISLDKCDSLPPH